MKKLYFGTVLLLLTLSTPATATVVGGAVTGGTAQTAGGTFQKLTVPLQNLFGTPDSVGGDTFQSPNLFGFDETQNILLPSPLTADTGTSPIPAGTVVASHYIFFDPGPSERVTGTVDFDSDVIAIMSSTLTLADSDFLANPDVIYLNPTSRGLEAGDSVTISGQRQILFDTVVLTAFSPAAAAAPEPNTTAFFGAGLALLGALRHSRGRLGS